MKIFLMVALVLSTLFTFSTKASADEACTQDYSYDRQQSLVIYHYKDASGEEQRLVVGQGRDMPEELKSKCWECWVDVLEWFNCIEK